MALANAPAASPTAWLTSLCESLPVGAAKESAALLRCSLVVEEPLPGESFRLLVPLSLVGHFRDFLSPPEVAGANWNVTDKQTGSEFAKVESSAAAVVHPGSVRLSLALTLTTEGTQRLAQLDADAARRARTGRTDVRVRDPMLHRVLLTCSGETVTGNGAVQEGGCDRQCRAALGGEVLPTAAPGTCDQRCFLGERARTLSTAGGITRSLLRPKFSARRQRASSKHGCSATLLVSVPLSVGSRGFARVVMVGNHSASWRPLGCLALRPALAFQDAVVTAAFYLGHS